MLNAEKYKEQIEEVGCKFALTKNNDIVRCSNRVLRCGECKFLKSDMSCRENITRWLLTEATEEIYDSEGNLIETGDLCEF